MNDMTTIQDNRQDHEDALCALRRGDRVIVPLDIARLLYKNLRKHYAFWKSQADPCILHSTLGSVFFSRKAEGVEVKSEGPSHTTLGDWIYEIKASMFEQAYEDHQDSMNRCD